MRNSLILLVPFVLLSSSAWAGSINYVITMNTTSIAASTGSIDFALDPGAGSDQSVTATVSNFVTNGSYDGSEILTGNVTGGPVAGGQFITLLANNTTADNDDLETFNYGTTLSFLVSLSGPALTAPDGSSTSPYEFIFSTYSDTAGTIPVLTTDPGGASATISISPDGVVGTDLISPEATIAGTPEPGTLWMLAGALALFAGMHYVGRGLQSASRL